MAQVVIYQTFRVEAQVQSKASLHNIFGGQIGIGSVFNLALLFFTIRIVPIKFSKLIHLLVNHRRYTILVTNRALNNTLKNIASEIQLLCSTITLHLSVM